MKIKRNIFWAVHTLYTLTLLVALTLLLSGCAAPRELERTQAVILMELHDTSPEGWATGQVGQWRFTGAVHQVDILKSAYPECVEHEIRHVFEGDWHVGPMHCR